jgi:hypothetical protein
MKRLYNPLLTHDDFLSIPVNQHTILIKNNKDCSFVRICCGAILVKELLGVKVVFYNNTSLSHWWIHSWCMLVLSIPVDQTIIQSNNRSWCAVLEFDIHFLETFVGEGCPITMC